MELKRVSYKVAKAIKELGFPQHCYFMSDVYTDDGQHYFINLPQTPDCDMWEAPNIEVVAKWLREEKGLYVWVRPEFWAYYGEHNIGFTHILSKLGDPMIETGESNEEAFHNTYEEALSAGIDKAIEILKSN